MATRPQTIDQSVQKRETTNLEQAILVDWYQETLQRFLGSPEAVDAFTAEMFTQARKSPKLYMCTVESTRFIIARVASLKLNPAIPNEVSLIPRNMKQANGKYADEMTVIYGYGGLRKLAMRSPEVKDIRAEDVRANDRYTPSADIVSLPAHTYPPAFMPRGRVIGYYAAVQFTSGNWKTWPMSVDEVQEHAKQYVHDMSRAPAWHKGERPDVADGLTSFDKMALKTCLRMLINGRDVPLSADVVQALQEEEVRLHVETPGERLGYDRDGNRPAITMGTGVTMDDLIEDIAGDQQSMRNTLERERQPVHVTTPKAGEKKARITQESREEPKPLTSDPEAKQEVSNDTEIWRRILRANFHAIPTGPLQDEAVKALTEKNFSHARGNELAGIASDRAAE